MPRMPPSNSSSSLVIAECRPSTRAMPSPVSVTRPTSSRGVVRLVGLDVASRARCGSRPGGSSAPSSGSCSLVGGYQLRWSQWSAVAGHRGVSAISGGPGEPPGDAAVEELVADPDDDATDQARVDLDLEAHVVAERATERRRPGAPAGRSSSGTATRTTAIQRSRRWPRPGGQYSSSRAVDRAARAVRRTTLVDEGHGRRLALPASSACDAASRLRSAGSDGSVSARRSVGCALDDAARTGTARPRPRRGCRPARASRTPPARRALDGVDQVRAPTTSAGRRPTRSTSTSSAPTPRLEQRAQQRDGGSPGRCRRRRGRGPARTPRSSSRATASSSADVRA